MGVGLTWKLREKYRALLDREEGAYKKAWGEMLTLCLAYPNIYRTGMANLGFQTVYNIINCHPECLCERAFLPEPEDVPAFEKEGIPFFSLESQRPLRDFDIVAFSLPFENDFSSILKMLSMGGIPLPAGRRGAKDPLIMGGGIAVTLNPEPLADFFDLFILGEAEETLPRFLDEAVAAQKEGRGREEFLFKVQAELKGIYVPRFYQVSYGEGGVISGRQPLDGRLPVTVTSGHAKDIDAFSTEQIITARETELGTMALIEVSRGCPRGCRFCAAGFVCRPVRFRRLDTLTGPISAALSKGRKIGLLGTAVSDHPELIPLCRFIRERGGEVGIASLRLDCLNPELLKLLKEGGVKTLALAPEAGSQRMRDMLNKGITEDQIDSAVDLLVEHGILRLRLYFMVGLPGEDDEDVEAIIELTRKIKHRAIKYSRGERPFRMITLSINQFIPKPATPWQWYPLTETGIVKRRVRKIEQALRREATVKVIHDLPKWNYIQALLSLGDRRVGEILLAVHRYNGNWPQALKEVSINPDFYVYRPKSASEILPWDFIDHGVSKALLLREYEKTRAAVSL